VTAIKHSIQDSSKKKPATYQDSRLRSWEYKPHEGPQLLNKIQENTRKKGISHESHFMAQTIRSIAPKIACHTHPLRTWLRQHGRQRMNNLEWEVSSSMETTFVLDVIKNSLPVWANFAYSHHALVNPSDGFRSLNWYKATVDAEDSVFFYVVDNAHPYSMVALSGQSSDWLVSLYTSTANLDIVTAHYEFRSSSGDFLNKYKEATTMVATTQTHPELIDTYWIIPEYATTPYGKVSFTRQDCRTFHSIFKYSRLIWCGRKSMHVVMEEN